ncbi:hypothetical protein ODQ17_17070 [Acinetobacter sp. IRS14]|uniref:hypothetical protein n=1 Tax=Acinetobacter sp. IRS14 TaxID=2983398 RepID=UPI002AFF3293|nr:hypothetical protein [Acinetobacter sp. IRS14]MEA1231088.1 hypothetical protein [Acinetobacter sp. IRS14]
MIPLYPFPLQSVIQKLQEEQHMKSNDDEIKYQDDNLDHTEDDYKETACESVGINSSYETKHKLELLIKLDNTNACRENNEIAGKVEAKILELLDKL